ncbi:hypothetical protein PVAND_012655 [Polypedilum vanderplanki]|uniref:Uncharacterized protein n=1 Tax=Polypedilum vanderplanki TaxID=319348 RepID=A0A9J6CM60_POLVA|nr:hypothetical protein PVAND_012655 [Polypedilum vanderplanki]
MKLIQTFCIFHSNLMMLKCKKTKTTTLNGIKSAPSTEMKMDIDEEISTKSSNLTQPSEIGNDQKFHKFIEFLERELKKRPEVVRNNFIHMNQAFLYENPVQE